MRVLLVSLACLLLAACADPGPEPYTEHDQPEDFVVEKAAIDGLPSSFNRNLVMEDDFFRNANAVTAADVQAFLESTPYGNRCFLAGERVNGRSAAEAIVAGAQSEGINPIVMVARMQVEKSLIGKSSRPSRNSVDFAFGCGCPDGRACNESYRGLDKQVACAARTLRRHYDGSIDGSSPWAAGRAKSTLDPIRVTPVNHATASLYSYTPWVLTGQGGNWLVWNVTRKYARAFEHVYREPGEGPSEEPPAEEPEEPVAPPANPAEPPPEVEPVPPVGEAPPEEAPVLRAEWIGDACTDDRSCRFANGSTGVCQRIPGSATGMCTVSCEGLCPDLAGHGTTFCVASVIFGGPEGGLCTRKSASDNGFCSETPGLQTRWAARYVGRSGASRRDAEVCLPKR